MDKCEFKKGIFIQRTCAQAAYHDCVDCGITVCSVHSRPVDDGTNQVLCHGCYMSKHDIDEASARVSYLESEAEFSLWYSSFRSEHVSSRRAFIFDASDYSEFEAGYSSDGVYLDDDNGFFDS